MSVLLLQLLLVLSGLLAETGRAVTFSSRLIHRFSEEVKALRVPRGGAANATALWPEKRSAEYYQLLVSSDFQRQNMKLGTHYELLFPSEGAPLYMGQSIVQDRDLNEYSPSGSSTSKHLTCSHQLCELSTNCKSPKESCPYTINYYSENTSTSGLLVEDVLHLASGNAGGSNHPVKAPIVLGCGMKQSGGYLDGVAPDGLMGLGIGEISVPSFLAKAGLIQNSFSMCFDEDESGRIFFGDQGPVTQKYTPFLPLNGKYETYIVGVEACCIGNSCLKQSDFNALVDSGASFTFLPNEVYERIADEFDRRVNATRTSSKGYPWKYCYNSSTNEMPKVPSLTLVLTPNNSFVVHDPIFPIYGMEGITAFCLAIQPTDGDIGTIGHNFMMGYRMVFDRENLKLGWSRSNCQDLEVGDSMPLSPNGRPTNPLPTNEQQRSPQGHAVAPAVAGRAPTSSASAAMLKVMIVSDFYYVMRLLLPLLLLGLHLPAHTMPHHFVDSFTC